MVFSRFYKKCSHNKNTTSWSEKITHGFQKYGQIWKEYIHVLPQKLKIQYIIKTEQKKRWKKKHKK